MNELNEQIFRKLVLISVFRELKTVRRKPHRYRMSGMKLIFERLILCRYSLPMEQKSGVTPSMCSLKNVHRVLYWDTLYLTILMDSYAVVNEILETVL